MNRQRCMTANKGPRRLNPNCVKQESLDGLPSYCGIIVFNKEKCIRW
jgi:hypothetical protein